MSSLELLEYLQKIYTFKEEGLHTYIHFYAIGSSGIMNKMLYVIPTQGSKIPKTSMIEVPFYNVFPLSIFNTKDMYLLVDSFAEKHKYYVERFIDLINDNLKTNIKKK